MTASFDAVRTDRGPAAIGPYSQAVRKGDWLFVSGQIALDPASGQMVPGGVVEQARRALENLRGIVEAAGGNLGPVVKTTVYLADMNDFVPVNEVYAEFFGDPAPARAAIQAAALPKGALFEIDAIAVLDS